ncbi:MAG TPA: hypothetical protein VJK05_02995 [archaeon]|nr:hypothetical protein [archaeon]
MDEKGQGALEYLLILGGAILIAAVGISILAISSSSGSNTVQGGQEIINSQLDTIRQNIQNSG